MHSLRIEGNFFRIIPEKLEDILSYKYLAKSKWLEYEGCTWYWSEVEAICTKSIDNNRYSWSDSMGGPLSALVLQDQDSKERKQWLNLNNTSPREWVLTWCEIMYRNIQYIGRITLDQPLYIQKYWIAVIWYWFSDSCIINIAALMIVRGEGEVGKPKKQEFDRESLAVFLYYGYCREKEEMRRGRSEGEEEERYLQHN